MTTMRGAMRAILYEIADRACELYPEDEVSPRLIDTAHEIVIAQMVLTSLLADGRVQTAAGVERYIKALRTRASGLEMQ